VNRSNQTDRWALSLRRSRNCIGARLYALLALGLLLSGDQPAAFEPALPGSQGALIGGASPETVAPHQVERESYLMGTICSIRGEAASRSAGLAAIEAGFAAIRESEEMLSTWRDDTPLARLAQAQVGEPVTVPVELMSALRSAAEVWDLTGGAFDPAIGSLVMAWDLRGEGRVPGKAELSQARARAGMQHLILDPRLPRVTVKVSGLSFDAGGFGKGEGLARAAAALDAAGLRNWLIDFGGQVFLSDQDSPRAIPVADPLQRDRPVATLRLSGVSAATSSMSEQPGHILDPRTGRSSESTGSVTGVGQDSLLVDALSTGLFVMGPDEGLPLAAGQAGIEVLYLVPENDSWVARGTAGMEALIEDLQVPWVTFVEESRP
jgi:thiamine biosynthesis lipoprotein